MVTARSSRCVRPTELKEGVEKPALPLLSLPGLVTRVQILAAPLFLASFLLLQEMFCIMVQNPVICTGIKR